MPHPLAGPLRRLQRMTRMAATAAGWHARPSFLIIGAQKAGTTALFRYLSRHPRLIRSAEKELYFFSPESFRGWTDNPAYSFYDRLKTQGFEPAAKPWAVRWYHAQFPVPVPGRSALDYEGTPDYLYYPLSPWRIHAYRPDMKLIVLLRDPVERAYSAWNMFRQADEPEFIQLRDDRGFDEAVHDEFAWMDRVPLAVGTDYVRRGLYHVQLRRFLSFFPAEQILILDSHQLKTNTRPTLHTVCQFLGVEPIVGDDWPLVTVGNYAGEMSSAVRERLTRFYAPHNAALFGLLGRTFDWGN